MDAGCSHESRLHACGACLKVTYCSDACATQDWTQRHWALCEGKREREEVHSRYSQYEEERVYPSGRFSNKEDWNLGLPSEEEEEEELEPERIPPGYVFWRGMWVPRAAEKPEMSEGSDEEDTGYDQWVAYRKSRGMPVPPRVPETVMVPPTQPKNWSDMFGPPEPEGPKKRLDFDSPSL